MGDGEPQEEVLQGIEARIRAIADQCAEETELLIQLRHVADASTAKLRADRLEGLSRRRGPEQ